MTLLTVKETAALLRVSIGQLYRIHAGDPRFPRAIKLGPQSTRFDADEVEEFLRNAARGTSGQHPRRIEKVADPEIPS
jgi:predicted DNA-binding transcriptional regulator AlpA